MRQPHTLSRLTPFAVLLLLLFTLVPAHSARADMAPPDFPPGSNVLPGGENTYVRMESETVTISLLKETKYVQSAAGWGTDRAAARVNAIFNMRNMGTQSESMYVRFPLGTLRGDGYGAYPEISDLTVKVNGQPVETDRMEGTRQNTEKYDGPWATFPVVFPAGSTVQVEINYSDYGATENNNASFTYLMQTGAGWYDTIGSADLIVRLPYPANSMNFLWGPEGYTIDGQDVRWHYDNLEPTSDNDLYFRIIVPPYWEKVLIEEENVKKKPNDGEAWGRLGKAYKETLFEHHGIRCDESGLQAYQKSIAAYAKSVELLPKDGLWHAGYADMLWEKISFCDAYENTTSPEADKKQLGIELRAALELAPEAEIVQNLDTWIKSWDPTFYNDYISPYPTATPNLFFINQTATAAVPQFLETVAAPPITETPGDTSAMRATALAENGKKLDAFYALQTQEAAANAAMETPAAEEPVQAPAVAPTSLPVSNTMPPDRMCGSALLAPLRVLGMIFIRAKKR